MYLLNAIVDHALPEKFGETSPHRIVFRNLVIGNPNIRTMTTVVAAAKWIAGLSEERVKTVSYTDFMEAVGDDGSY